MSEQWWDLIKEKLEIGIYKDSLLAMFNSLEVYSLLKVYLLLK